MAAQYADVVGRAPADLSARKLPLKKSPELEQALNEGELHTLLMTYVHLSGDESMLDKFAPHIKSPYA